MVLDAEVPGVPEVPVDLPPWRLHPPRRFSLRGPRPAAAAAKQVRKNISKARACAACTSARKIKTREIETTGPAACRTRSRTKRRIGIEIVCVVAEPVKNLSLFFVREDVVRLLYLFELVLRGFITRIHIRVMFARQAAVRFFYLVRFGVFFDAQNLVIILFRHLRKVPLNKFHIQKSGSSERVSPPLAAHCSYAYFFCSSSTSTYSASITLSSDAVELLSPSAPAVADEACSSVADSPPEAAVWL